MAGQAGRPEGRLDARRESGGRLAPADHHDPLDTRLLATTEIERAARRGRRSPAPGHEILGTHGGDRRRPDDPAIVRGSVAHRVVLVM
jgi:hypothetical protein